MKVSVTCFILLGFAAVLTLFAIGCDFVSGGKNDCVGDTSLLAAPADFSLYVGEGATSFQIISDTLAYAQPLAQALSYSVTSDASEVVSAKLEGSDILFVELTPLQAGEAQVEIAATDACGVSEKVAFTVKVADVCALRTEQPSAVYFPIQVGKIWTYDYLSNSSSRQYPDSRTEGTLTWEIITASACENGKQTFFLQETVEGVATLPNDNPDYESEVFRTKTRAGHILGRQLSIEAYTDDFFVSWIHAPNTPDTIATKVDTSWQDVTRHFQSWETTLKRNVGIVQWSGAFSDKYGGKSLHLVLDEH